MIFLDDKKCLLWATLGSLYSEKLKEEFLKNNAGKKSAKWDSVKYQPSTYEHLLHSINHTNVDFPSGFEDIKKLEEQNPQLIFRVYEIFDKGYFMTYSSEKTPNSQTKFVDLVFVSFVDEEYELDSHFFFVECRSAFFAKIYIQSDEETETTSISYCKNLVCERCLTLFASTSVELFAEHQKLCQQNLLSNFEIQEEEICFTNFKKMSRPVLTGYFDFETYKEKVPKMCYPCQQKFKATKVGFFHFSMYKISYFC